MRYDLWFDIYGCTFYIQCSLANKPATLSELIIGIESGTVVWQPDYESRMKALWRKLEKLGFFEFGLARLTTDFSTQKPIRHNINWIPTEKL